jgi:hypothetical protein
VEKLPAEAALLMLLFSDGILDKYSSLGDLEVWLQKKIKNLLGNSIF